MIMLILAILALFTDVRKEGCCKGAEPPLDTKCEENEPTPPIEMVRSTNRGTKIIKVGVDGRPG